MDIRASKETVPASWFLDRYMNSTDKQGIKSPADRWYVRRSKYSTTFLNKKLVVYASNEATDCFINKGINTSIQTWKLECLVDAIQNLFRMVGLSGLIS